MKKMFNLSAFIGGLFLSSISFSSAFGVELVIGEEQVKPGIVFIFEGAVKDTISPKKMHLAENETHVHIEARANWAATDIPEGTPPNGFVAYLHINAKITNEVTGMSTFIDLLPHVNLIDNFHYARNIALPGKISDLYSVEFNILPPASSEVGLHKDWVSKYGRRLTRTWSFQYKNVDFEEIAKASRN